ncbi:MAG: hypothetical protein R3321_10170 [Nitrososphaeraceae archaeon]|nr:hypothetical protein [Nitrososphaeraceae archaeon]
MVQKYKKHTVYTDGGTWYDQVCNIIGLKHYLHSSIEKSLMERVNQYLKDRIKSFDNYYPFRTKEECNLFQVHHWIQYNSLSIPVSKRIMTKHVVFWFKDDNNCEHSYANWYRYNDTITNKSNFELDEEVSIILN